MDEVAVDGVSIGLTGRTAILDTVSYNLCPLLPQQTLTRSLLQGTTLLIAPAPDAEAIHAAIPGAKSDGQGGESALLYCLSTLFLRSLKLITSIPSRLHSPLHDECDFILDFRWNCFQHPTLRLDFLTSH